MSAKSSKPVKKMSVPRKLEEIQSEYGQTANNAGQLQYQIYILSSELETTNQLLRALNNEAAARNQLDKQTAAKEVTSEIAK